MDEACDAVGLVDALDDLCLQHVASFTDSLKDLLRLGSTCRRLRSAVAAADPAWQRHLLADFGLTVQGVGLKRQYDVLRHVAKGQVPPPLPAPYSCVATASSSSGTSQQPPAASSQAQQDNDGGASSSVPRRPGAVAASAAAAPTAPLPSVGGVRPFLPFSGVATDGGCDDPAKEFWVGHLFTPSSRTFFSSEAQTRNIHCVAILQPSGYDQADPHRAFLLDRLQLPAAYLSRDVMESAWEDHAGQELPELPARAVVEARRVLSQCATEVLEDLFIHCFHQMLHRIPWGRLLARGPPPNQQHQQQHQQDQDVLWENNDPAVGLHAHVPLELLAVDEVARQIHDRKPSVPFNILKALPDSHPRLLFGEPPLRPLLQARQRWRQQKRDGQAQAPKQRGMECGQEPSLLRTLGLFDSVLLDRHLNVTCPVRCGALFAMSAGGEGGSSGGASSSGGGGNRGAAALASHQGRVVAGGGASSGSSGADTSAETAMSAEIAAGLTNGLAHVPCVRAFDDASTINDVQTSVRSGLLPPIAGYYTNGCLEWVEFERPPLLEVLQSSTYTLPADSSRLSSQPKPQQKEQGPSNRASGLTAGADAAVQPPSVGRSSSGSPTQSSTSRSDTPGHQRNAKEQKEQHPSASSLLHPTGVPCRVLPVLWFRFLTREERLAMRQQLRQNPAAAGAAAASAAGGGGDNGASAAAGAGGGAAATAEAVAERRVQGAAAAAAVSAGDDASVRQLTAQTVPTPDLHEFPLSHNLTVLAPGVGHVYGWTPTVAADHMTLVHLQQPWVANGLLAKLIGCEDAQPHFNRSRGGCNIDAGIVAVQGPAAVGGAAGSGPMLQLLDGVSLL